MSSLAATQADGYYVPPEYYESGKYKKQSRNSFAGSKGHNQYLRRGVVRFELPYNGFCLKCGTVVGKGTRFNATKKEAGNYFSTKIYEFHMKCRKCAQCTFVIQTNPKESGFDYLEGIHRQVKEFDTHEAGTAGVIDTEEGNRVVHTDGTSEGNGGLARLEKVASGKRKTMTEHEELQALMRSSQKTKYDDAASNAALRKTFRKDRCHKKQRLGLGKAMGWKQGMELADVAPEDTKAARGQCFRDSRKVEQNKFRKLRTSSIFSSQKRKKRHIAVATRQLPDNCTSGLHAAWQVEPDVARSSTVATTSTLEPSMRRDSMPVTPVKVKKEDYSSPESQPPQLSSALPDSSHDSQPPQLSSALSALASYESDSD